MKIGIDARMWGPDQTGIGRFVDRLLHHLVEIPSGHEFVLFVLEERLMELSHMLQNEREPLVSLRFVPVRDTWYGWGEQLRFPRALYREDLDLLHVPHFNVPLAYRRPFVATIHDMTPWFYPGHRMGRSLFRRFLFRRVFRSACLRADRLMAVSRATREDVQMFVGSRDIDVVHEGPGLFDADDNTQEGGDSDAAPMTSPYLFSLGVWREHKNFSRLIRAFERVREQSSRNLFLVLGGSWQKSDPAVLKTLRQSSVRHHVITPGFLRAEELPRWYRNARAVVVPSLAEGFGFVGLEAMSEGTPVVAAHAGSLPEVYGSAARYCNPHRISSLAEGIEDVLWNQRLRAMLVARGKDQVRRYSWRRMTERILRVYEGVLGS